MMGSREEDFLLLSGIQHFYFCKRQWALIHIEQQWEENVRTVEGQNVHKKVDKPFIREKRNEMLIVRSMPIHSKELGATGVSDVVEFKKDKEGVPIQGSQNKYIPIPIEYKRGKPKQNKSDIVQLVAQAMCLEEMLLCKVSKGYIYYDKIKQRIEVPVSSSDKQEVRDVFSEMHHYFDKRYTPRVKTGPFCKSCSLKNLCIPNLMKKQSVSNYIERKIRE
ncbi:CRISPR-associated protein Cas4 [Natranaerobius trueperi]|uniref:CRISPR-associated exonuclease Cas4 n=1 Tax=Natranaerobius trueperi TaxID=759412 RepID=A0A226C0H0_9FIRM|nr:CRISPR-associated protein Cas4 [Natranaerobius trueperi]OWZ83867.1 CRISPR-associated protein Cas4 [Natranaerobius trueperi]